MRRWREKNRETHSARSREYYSTHREQAARTGVAYRAANREAVAAWKRNYEAAKKRAPGRHTAADITSQYEKQNGLCYWCSKPLHRKYHVDHVIPLSRGGSNWPDNIVCSCAVCNLKKGAKLPSEFKKAA